MKSVLNPYLGFKDNAREAFEFYKTVFGGKVELHTFEEYHASEDLAEMKKIMHATLTADNGIMFMGADTPNSMTYEKPAGISMSLSGDDEAELSGYYEKLLEGGMAPMQFEVAPWGDKFGMVVDKFGITWMVNVTLKKD